MTRGNRERLTAGAIGFVLGALSMIVVPVAAGLVRERLTGRASW